MRLNDRADLILRAADYMGGGITMRAVYALCPHTQPDILRRQVSKLVKRGALAWVWAGELGCKIWLTTSGVDGHESGVRRWLKSPVMARAALETGYAGRAVKLPVHFIHDQIAGLVSLGLGAGGVEFERELRRDRTGRNVADGAAWPEPDRRIVIEVERMIGQSTNRWKRKNGIADRVAESLWTWHRHRDWQEQYLIVAPSSMGKHPDLEQDLAKMIEERAEKHDGSERPIGWWFLPIEDLEADPRWHRVGQNSVSPRPLVGIRKRREAGEAAQKERGRIDAERKEKKRQQRMASLPARPRRSTVIVCTDAQLRALGCLPSLSTDDKLADPPHDSDPTDCSNQSCEAQTLPDTTGDL